MDHIRSIMYLRDNSVGIDAMPPLAKSIVDEEYMAILKDWLETLDPGCTPVPVPDKNISLHFADSEEKDHPATHALDGDFHTFWQTPENENFTHPHEIQFDLGESLEITGFRYYPRKDDLENGMVGNYEFYLSDDGQNWGEAIISGTFPKSKEEQEVFINPSYARYIRFVALSEVNGKAETSIAELDILARMGNCNGPGGISGNLQLWLTGDNETLEDSIWQDQSGKENHFTLTGGNPEHWAGKLNFNDLIRFDKSDEDDYFTLKSNLDISSFFIVYRHTSSGPWETPFTNDYRGGIFQGDDHRNLNVYHHSYTPTKARYGANYVNGDSTNLLEHKRPAKIEIHTRILQANENDLHTYYIGRNHNNWGMTGEIAEIISFNSTLETPERERIESYLALKYGITLTHNYYGSNWDGNNGTIIWQGGKRI